MRLEVYLHSLNFLVGKLYYLVPQVVGSPPF